MATRRKTSTLPQEDIQKAANPLDTPERFRLGELGYQGLSIFNGVSNSEIKKELNWPYSIDTYKQMSYHSSINSALTMYENIISKVDWKVIPPEKATEQEKEQSKRIHEMMHDMQHSFPEFIKDVLTMNIYGFCVAEKVYRRRYQSNGSKYNDGLVGWKKLSTRAQETIEKFIFSDDGNEILGVKQNLSAVYDQYSRYGNRKSKEVTLPISKVMLFRAGRHRGDPFGKSMLRDAYLAWRYLTALEEIEAVGVTKDMNGIPVLTIPAQYMSADAPPEQQALYQNFKNIIRNLQVNSQSGIILPSAVDPETRNKLFTIELLSTDGKKNFDTSKVKEYYKNLILISLGSDILTMGQGSTGSFALASVKNSLTGSYAEAMLKTIVDVINNDLIRQTYELNGWDASRACTIDYDGLESESLEDYSKAIQRYLSTSGLEKDRAVMNAIRMSIGVDPKPEDEPVDESLLSPMTSRSGDSLEVGRTGDGTRTSVNGSDSSSNNLENSG